MNHWIRRRRVLVDGKFQFAVAMRLVAYVYVYLTLFALLANASAIYAVLARADDLAAYVAAVDRLRVFVQVFIVPLALTFVAMCIHGVFLTHRLAGPMYRLRTTLRQIQGKILPRQIRFRKGDYFQDLCSEMNGLLSSLRAEVTEIRELSDRLAAEARTLDAADCLPGDAQQSLLSLSNGFTRLRQLVNGYELEGEPAEPVAERKPVGAVPTSC